MTKTNQKENIYIVCDDGFKATIRVNTITKDELLQIHKEHGLCAKAWYCESDDEYYTREIQIVNEKIKLVVKAPLKKAYKNVMKACEQYRRLLIGEGYDVSIGGLQRVLNDGLLFPPRNVHFTVFDQ